MGIPPTLQPPSRAHPREMVILLTLPLVIALLVWLVFSRFRLGLAPEAIVNGVEALHNKEVAKARALFDAELKRDPQNPQLYVQICGACAEAEQWSLEADYARRGVQACKYADNHTRAFLYEQLADGLAEVDSKHPQTEAIEAAQRAFDLDPEDPQALNGLGYILADNDMQLDKAQEYIIKALHLVSQQADGQPGAEIGVIEDSYGWTLYKKGKYDEAVNALQQAIADVSEGSESQSGAMMKVLYYHLGAACRMAGRIEDARYALDKALQYDQNYTLAKSEEDLLPPPAATPATTKPRDRTNRISQIR